MSAVLSRRVLADLMEQYGQLTSKDRRLAPLIDEFITGSHPSWITDNLHQLREIGNIAAHTQTDPVGSVVDVTKEEAQWTLKVVNDLFDYFIVSPEENKKRRDALDQKLKGIRRKPLQ